MKKIILVKSGQPFPEEAVFLQTLLGDSPNMIRYVLIVDANFEPLNETNN